jgi:hypothetical protein
MGSEDFEGLGVKLVMIDRSVGALRRSWGALAGVAVGPDGDSITIHRYGPSEAGSGQ